MGKAATKRQHRQLPLDHLQGCPAERVESYHAHRPAREGQREGDPVTVTRCIECAAETVRPGHLWDGKKGVSDGGDAGEAGEA